MVLPQDYNLAQSEALERNSLGSRYNVTNMNSLVTEKFDYISTTYTDGLLTTVVYKSGGSSGTTVATLTITYTADDCVETITKT